MKSSVALIALAMVALAVLLGVSRYLRQDEFRNATGAPGLEASYHVLLTDTALLENDFREHWLLPTVTLGAKADKGIPWGSAVPTSQGSYIYTSFTPAGFLAPCAWFRCTGNEPSLSGLATFNFLLGCLASYGILLFLIEVLTFTGASPSTAACCALAGAAISVFSREALLSQGIIYWCQSLYQVLLIGTVWSAFRCLSRPENVRASAWVLVGITFLGMLTEWTGFFTAGGLVVAFWMSSAPRLRRLAVVIAASIPVAAVAIVLHFGLALGFRRALRAMAMRFLARSALSGTTASFLNQYWLSFGLFLVITATAVVTLFICRKLRPSLHRRPILLLIVITAFPLLENVVLLQHATQFSFDRLKFIVPASLVLALALAHIRPLVRAVGFIAVCAACVQGYHVYRRDLEGYSGWQQVDAANRQFRDRIMAQDGLDGALYASHFEVRAYANLLFHHGIYEKQTEQSAKELMQTQNAPAMIFLRGKMDYIDLPTFEGATIDYADGRTVDIPVGN